MGENTIKEIKSDQEETAIGPMDSKVNTVVWVRMPDSLWVEKNMFEFAEQQVILSKDRNKQSSPLQFMIWRN